MLISVVIPTCHRNELLRLCLDCLTPGKQVLSFDLYEVLVTDDGTTTTSKELITREYSWVKWYKGPKKGPAANRNNGAKYASGAWIIFADDDCLPDKQWLSEYYTAICKHEHIDVFEGRTYVNREKRRFDEESPINITGGYLWSCNFCISRDLFQSIGGFDERFQYAAMEDVDLRVVLQKKNIEILFVPNASVCHPWRIRNDREFQKKHFKSMLQFLDKHKELRKNYNFLYYLKMTVRDFITNFFPNCIRYKFAGSKMLFLTYYYNLRNSLILLLRIYQH